MNEIDYEVRDRRGGPGHVVRGSQVGRFAVRRVAPGTYAASYHGGGNALVTGYAVDHIPSGTICVANLDRYTALAVADDLSRFALRDVDAEDVGGALAQVGPALGAWLNEIAKTRRHVNFRDWCALREARAAQQPARQP